MSYICVLLIKTENKMETKKCFKCGEVKQIELFYKHPRMKDGHVNKCIDCNKKDIHEKYKENIKDEKYVEKERLRGREKYKRLNYVERTQYKKSYSNKTRNIHPFFKKMNLDLKNKELHHWNYSLKYDVFILNKKAHKLIHKTIKYDELLNCFVTDNGLLLNSKKLHYEFILNVFKNNNVNYEIDVYPL